MKDLRTTDPIFWSFWLLAVTFMALALLLVNYLGASIWVSLALAGVVWIFVDWLYVQLEASRGWGENMITWRPLPQWFFRIVKLICVIVVIVIILSQVSTR